MRDHDREKPPLSQEEMLKEVARGGIENILTYFEIDQPLFDAIRHSPVFQSLPGHWSRYRALELVLGDFQSNEELLAYLTDSSNTTDFQSRLRMMEQDGVRIAYDLLPSHLRHEWGYGILLRTFEDTSTHLSISEIYRLIWGLLPGTPLFSPELSKLHKTIIQENPLGSGLERYHQRTPKEDVVETSARANRVLSSLSRERKSANSLALPSGYYTRKEFEAATGSTSVTYFLDLAKKMFPNKERDFWVYQFGSINGYSLQFIDFVKEQVFEQEETGATLLEKATNARQLIELQPGQGLLADLCQYAESQGLLRTYPIHLYHHKHIHGEKKEIEWLQGGGLVIIDDYENAKALIDEAAQKERERTQAISEGFLTVTQFLAEFPEYEDFLYPKILSKYLLKFASENNPLVKKFGNAYYFAPQLILHTFVLPDENEIALQDFVARLHLTSQQTEALYGAQRSDTGIGIDSRKLLSKVLINYRQALDWYMITYKLPREYATTGMINKTTITERFQQIAALLPTDKQEEFQVIQKKFLQGWQDFFHEQDGLPYRAVFDQIPGSDLPAKKKPLILYDPHIVAETFIKYLHRQNFIEEADRYAQELITDVLIGAIPPEE